MHSRATVIALCVAPTLIEALVDLKQNLGLWIMKPRSLPSSTRSLHTHVLSRSLAFVFPQLFAQAPPRDEGGCVPAVYVLLHNNEWDSHLHSSCPVCVYVCDRQYTTYRALLTAHEASAVGPSQRSPGHDRVPPSSTLSSTSNPCPHVHRVSYPLRLPVLQN